MVLTVHKGMARLSDEAEVCYMQLITEKCTENLQSLIVTVHLTCMQCLKGNLLKRNDTYSEGVLKIQIPKHFFYKI